MYIIHTIRFTRCVRTVEYTMFIVHGQQLYLVKSNNGIYILALYVLHVQQYNRYH
jgi:hypothetical protein